MRYLFEKLTTYQNDDEIYKLLPSKIDLDIIVKFRNGAD
jgi:hypothetical protein